jgi:hypothetical protein
MRTGGAHLADKLNLITLNVANKHDFELGEEMQAQVCDGVAQNRLLQENHVAPCFRYFLADVGYKVALLFEQSIHLLVVRDNNSILDL